MKNNTLLALSCATQNYPWGKLGEDSTVAKLWSAAAEPNHAIPSVPFAELWYMVCDKFKY